MIPTFEEDGPKSLAELRAARTGDDPRGPDDDVEDERRFRDPDEAAEAD